MIAIHVLMAILLAVAFYWLRCRWRLAYAAIEIVSGIGVIVAIGYVPFTFDPDASSFIYFRYAFHTLTLMGAIYLLVRGLDNLEQSLPLKWHAWWRRFFGSPHS
jgi:multisubunit Na+/H+ antiporter MnhB subunit